MLINMTTIILYSNYSQSSKNLIQNIERHFNNYSDMFKFLCIDNTSIRNKIVRNRTLKIEKVPSIIVVDNGIPHVLQGKTAFDYIEEVHRQYISSNEPDVTSEIPQIISEDISPQKQSTQKQSTQKQSTQIGTSISDLELIQTNTKKSVDEESDDEDDVMKIARQMKKSRGDGGDGDNKI